jgi:hypothetical protein
MNNLISNMVRNIEFDSPKHIDLILSGGAFNAIYLVGCLYFIKEMEYQNKIIIQRVSTCSASSFVALFYFTNCLEFFETKIYNTIVENFKRNKKYLFSDEDVKSMFDVIENHLYDVIGLTEYEILKKVNYKLYISYFDIKKCKRVVKKKYKSLHDIFETITKSSHIPFVTMNTILYKNKYMDGWQPHIFTNAINNVNDKESGNISNCKTIEKMQLFIDLLGKDKIKDCIVLKNTKSVKEKIMNGILDTYSFFYQNGKCETSMCGYITIYNFSSYIKYYSLYIFSYVLCLLLYLYVFFLKVPLYNAMNFHFFKIMLDFFINIYYSCIEYICF